ncbi:hypothetical protein RD110_23780 [Rhodoferax koreense]|uniref:ABC transporter substrate-binding protein n=1 Tax=Rhodoferax koreensis TaxID=1842727 RepID=A0A1P8K1H0_9BURK|nr:tripartite tricarboxylate transporter substrate binding protein [Rhodoferax koreense]APW39850.1 hypothetical protein RD110_23780 [Rhodoferax koreense]
MTLLPSRRQVLGLGTAVAFAALVNRNALAADSRPVRLVLPLSPGGAMDVLGRGLAQQLGTRLGVSFIVENRAGAGGNIATEFVAGEKPDGNTLLLTGNSLVANTTLYAGQVRYDALRSFAPVTIVATSPTVIVVRNDQQLPDLAALLRQARTRGISVGTSGHGNGNHIALVKMQAAAGGDMQHIPYKGAGPAVIGLLGGETDAAIVALPAASAHLLSGKLRALAVVEERRSATAPQVPTIAEAGLPVPIDTGWFGLLAPAGTPPAIVARWQKATAEALATPSFRDMLVKQGFDPVGSSTQAFVAQLESDVARFPPLLKSIGARVD